MIKIVTPDSFNWQWADVPLANIIPLGKTGVDNSFFKVASCLEKELVDLKDKAEPNKTYVHLIALGDLESVGANANGDGFHKKANKEYHSYFVKNAKYYRHHKNSPNDPHFGKVVASAHNDKMGRVELIAALENDKCAEELHKLETKGEFPVSMACFLDPETPVNTNLGYKAIKDIQPGDLVLSHDGKYHKVKSLKRSNYTGNVINFNAFNNNSTRIRVTCDHLFYARTLENDYTWIHADHINSTRRLAYIHVTEVPNQPAITEPLVAKFLAYYTAFGSLKDNRIVFNIEDNLLRIELLDSLDAAGISYTEQTNCTIVTDAETIDFIKALTPYKFYMGLFNSSKDIKLQYIATLFDLGNKYIGPNFIIKHSNLLLSLSLRDLLFSVDINKKPFNINNTTITNTGLIRIANTNLSILKLYSKKLKNLNTKDEIAQVPPQYNDPSNRDKPRTELVIDVPVYNLEVEDSESYTVFGIATHNCKVAYDVCSICNNKAKTRKDYCEHAKNDLGSIYKDGSLVYVDNPEPHFFDISGVVKPADRIAYAFRKLASVDRVIGGAELAEQMNITAPLDFLEANESGLSKLAKQKYAFLHKLSELEKRIEGVAKGLNKINVKPINDEKLSTLKTAANDNISSLFGALADNGICLAPVDFFNLVLNKQANQYQEYISEAAKLVPGMFTRCINMSNVDVLNNSKYDPSDKINNNIKTACENLNENSLFKQAFDRRIIGSNGLIKVASLNKPSTQAEFLVNEYAAYQLAFLTSTPSNLSSELILQNYSL